MHSPSSNRRRFAVRHAVVVADVGCGCRRPKLLSLLSTSSSSLTIPTNPKTTTSTPLSPSAAAATTTYSSSSHWDTTATTSSSNGDTSSPSQLDDSPSSRKKVAAASSAAKKKMKGEAVERASTKKGVVEESEAVVKDSSDPYVDFRESMLDMVAEKEIYAWEDLRDLLNRLLDLNSPYHHHLILRAFAEILNLLFSPPSPPPPLRPGGVGQPCEEGASWR